MNSRQLEIFCAIMVHGTMTEAAEVLHVSQPALSQALKHLESQIGVELFVRSKGRLVPRPEAHRLFSDAKAILGSIKAFERQAKTLRNQGEVIRIASSYSPALTLLPIASNILSARFPSAKIEIDIAPAEDVVRKVQNSEADVGVVLRADAVPLLDIEVIGNTKVVCLMRENDPLASLEKVTAKDLLGRRIITYPVNTNVGDLVERAILQDAGGIDIAMLVQTAFTAFGFILHGHEIGVIEGLAVSWAHSNGLTTRPFHPIVPVPISIVVKSSTMTKIKSSIIDCIRNSLSMMNGP